MRMAYADPPYLGQAKRHYGDHPDYAGEVDHDLLIHRLLADYPDGWALSLSSPCFWLFEAMGLRPEDDLHDLFPGSRAVARAWDSWRAQGRLAA